MEVASAAFTAHAAGAPSVDLPLFSQMMLGAPVLDLWAQVRPRRAEALLSRSVLC